MTPMIGAESSVDSTTVSRSAAGLVEHQFVPVTEPFASVPSPSTTTTTSDQVQPIDP